MIGGLTSPEYEVPGIDFGEDLGQRLSGEFPDAQRVTADATEESVPRDPNVGQFAGAAVVIGIYKGDRQCGR